MCRPGYTLRRARQQINGVAVIFYSIMTLPQQLQHWAVAPHFVTAQTCYLHYGRCFSGVGVDVDVNVGVGENMVPLPP